MDNFNKLVKQLQKQDEAMQKLMSSDFTKFISSINKATDSLTQYKPQFYKETSISDVFVLEEYSLSKKLLAAINFDLQINEGFNRVHKLFENNPLKSVQYNSLSKVLSDISIRFQDELTNVSEFKEDYIVKEAVESINDLTEESLSKKEYVSHEDLENIRDSFITQSSYLFSKTKSEKTRELISYYLTIIGFIISCYNLYTDFNSKSNNEIYSKIEGNKVELKNDIEGLKNFITNELNKINEKRVANCNVNLRYSNKSKSKILGIVKKGQTINVIEIQHKHLLIQYIDFESGEPKSGFVVKKYFKRQK